MKEVQRDAAGSLRASLSYPFSYPPGLGAEGLMFNYAKGQNPRHNGAVRAATLRDAVSNRLRFCHDAR